MTRAIGGWIVTAGLAVAGGAAYGQAVTAGNPTREFVYAGGRLIAVQNLPKQAYMTATPNTLRFGAGGGTQQLSISANSDVVWWITSNSPDWIGFQATITAETGSPTKSGANFEGHGSTVVTVTALTPNTSVQRQTLVTVNFYRQGAEANTFVVQDAGAGLSVTVTGGPGNASFPVISASAALTQTLQYRVQSSASDVWWVEFQISYGLISGESCNVVVTTDAPGGYYYFQSDSVWAYNGPWQSGVANPVVANSACSVPTVYSTYGAGGGTARDFTVTVPYTLKPEFRGRHEIWVTVHTADGGSTLVMGGTWSVAELNYNSVPKVTGPSPTPQDFTQTGGFYTMLFDVRSDNGYMFIPVTDMRLFPTDSPFFEDVTTCYLRLTRPDRLVLYTYSAGGYWYWEGTAKVGEQTAPLGNGACSVNQAGTSVSTVDPFTMRIVAPISIPVLAKKYWWVSVYDQYGTWFPNKLGSITWQ